MSIDPNRVKEIFLAAADLPDQTGQAAYLERACCGDVGLRQRVEELLRSHEPEGSFLGTPAVELAAPDVAAQQTIDSVRPDGTPRFGHEEEDEALGFLAPATRPDSLGRIGHYEVLQVLGKGGFGIVLRAFDDILQRVVAIKVMAPQMAATSPARKRFLREARSSAQVRHENVVQVYEVAEQSLPYLVMEFIPGETLQQRLDRKGPLEIQETLRIGRQIAEGLAAAHATDLIHRDIKPGNVLLEGGHFRVKITDFGLARAADDASMSQSGMIAGTPMYMAPEQALGQTLDQRADLFSLGSVLYQMVSGRAPFRANTTIAVLKRVAEDAPRNIREIIPETPQWLCDIIAKLHAKNPADRYQSAREVADVLANCESQLKEHSKLKDLSLIPRVQAHATVAWKWVAVVAFLLPLLAFGLYAVTRPGSPPNVSQNETSGPSTPEATPVSVAKRETPPLAIAPFDATQARAHQEAWDKHLGVPVEYTNSIGMKFVLVPKGKSWLGGGKDKPGDMQVEIPADFYLGKYEVSQAEWEKLMGDNPSSCRFQDSHRYPVETVSWNMCQLFVEKLNQLMNERGWVYRLPREAEWEYACRGGPVADRANSAFDFYLVQPTNTLLPEHANFDKDETTKLGSYQPNALGLYDMHGNVHEWCLDEISPDRACRGGTWKYGAQECRAGLTSKFLPSEASRHLGLRLARVRIDAPSFSVAPFTDADVSRLAALPAEQQAEECKKELYRRNPEFRANIKHTIDKDNFTELIIQAPGIRDLSPVRGLMDLRTLECSSGTLEDISPVQGLRLTNLGIRGSGVSDLTPLKGIPLTGLELSACQNLTDLSPLNGLPITALHIAFTRIKDLTALRNMKLVELNCEATEVSDLSPLAGMPMTHLNFRGTPVTDIAVLKGMPLKVVTCDFQSERDAAILRDIKTLERINELPVAEFWRKFDAHSNK